MARLAALGGEDALGRVKAGHVVGLCERPHQDHVAAVLGGGHGIWRGEHDRPLGGARRRRDALREHVEVGVAGERGVQQRVEPVGVDRDDRTSAVQQALLDGIDGKPHGRLRGALGVARLEHEEAALLDRELRVLHVLVVALEAAQDLHQLVVRLGHQLLHVVQVARVADAGHHVLALRVDEEVAGGRRLAGDLVARERDAAARAVALVAEHHLLNVDRRAPFVRDAVDAAVADRPFAEPRVEDRADRLGQLLLRLLGELLAGLVGEHLLEALGQRLQRVHVQLDVMLDPRLRLGRLDQVLVALTGDAAADVAEHLDEAPVGVPGEALVVGPTREPLDRLVVQPEVEDGVHHPGHRLARAAADRDEQRVVGVAQLLVGLFLEAFQRLGHLILHPLREGAVGLHVGHARLGGDREAGGHALGTEHARHLSDVRALAAQQLAHVA